MPCDRSVFIKAPFKRRKTEQDSRIPCKGFRQLNKSASGFVIFASASDIANAVIFALRQVKDLFNITLAAPKYNCLWEANNITFSHWLKI